MSPLPPWVTAYDAHYPLMEFNIGVTSDAEIVLWYCSECDLFDLPHGHWVKDGVDMRMGKVTYKMITCGPVQEAINNCPPVPY